MAHLDIVLGLCWKRSCKPWIVPPVLQRCKNIATCSSAEICFEFLRLACSCNSCTSFWKTCFGISNASLKHTGWPVNSSLSHAMPVRTEVFIGVGNSEGPNWVTTTAAAVAARNNVSLFLCLLWVLKEACRALVFLELVETIITGYRQQKHRKIYGHQFR